MRVRFSALALISVLLLTAVACGSEPADGGVVDARVAKSGTVASAADFSIPVARSIDGKIESSDFSLAANRGKATVLYFSFAG